MKQVLNNPYSPQDKIKKSAIFGKWSVSIKGDMSFDSGKYDINSDQLRQNDWITHMFEKKWIDFNDFIPAYFQALKNIGCKNIEMITK